MAELDRPVLALSTECSDDDRGARVRRAGSQRRHRCRSGVPAQPSRAPSPCPRPSRSSCVGARTIARPVAPPQDIGQIVTTVRRPRLRSHALIDPDGCRQVLVGGIEPSECGGEEPQVTVDRADASLRVSDRMTTGERVQLLVQRRGRSRIAQAASTPRSPGRPRGAIRCRDRRSRKRSCAKSSKTVRASGVTDRDRARDTRTPPYGPGTTGSPRPRLERLPAPRRLAPARVEGGIAASGRRTRCRARS